MMVGRGRRIPIGKVPGRLNSRSLAFCDLRLSSSVAPSKNHTKLDYRPMLHEVLNALMTTVAVFRT